MKRLPVITAVVLMIVGLVLVLRNNTGNDPSASGTPGSAAGAAAATPDATSPPVEPDAGSGPEVTVPFGPEEGPVFTLTTIEGLATETVPGTTVPLPEWVPAEGLVARPVDATGCSPVESGFGVVMRPWGQVMLPFAAGWPTNTPGQAPNCAPDTAFGAAVVAAHALYIDAFAPELIPTISEATPAQRERLWNHPGPADPAGLPFVCEPVGWSQLSYRTFRIFTQCGDGPVKATDVTVKRKDDRWLLVYPPTGDHHTEDAAGGEAFYPFAGGE